MNCQVLRQEVVSTLKREVSLCYWYSNILYKQVIPKRTRLFWKLCLQFRPDFCSLLVVLYGIIHPYRRDAAATNDKTDFKFAALWRGI